MKNFVLYACLFFVGTVAFAQEKEDLLKKFNELRIQFRDTNIKYEQIKILASDYLERAKKTEKKEFIGRGYYLLALRDTNVKRKLQYLDSTISNTKNLEGDTRFPMHAYLAKGRTFHHERNYPEALTNYLLAESAAALSGNLKYQYDIKYNIAFLKRLSGNYEEAEKLFKECLTFEKSQKKMYLEGYLYTLLQLSATYYESEQTAKSTKINNEGIRLSLDNNLSQMYYTFVVYEGANLCVKGDYQASTDSIQKGISHIYANDQLVAKFYLAKNDHALGKNKKAIDYFKKVDTIFNKNNNLFPPLRESYIYLIKDAKEGKDERKELYYTKQLLKIDSTIHANYRHLSQNISKKYDIPALVLSKERLITKLETQNKQITEERDWIAIAGGFTSILAIALLIYYIRLKKKYEKRYNKIIQKSNSIVEEEIIVKNAKPQAVSLGIDQHIITEILQGLEVFEQGDAFLTNQISLKDAAKIINTNSKYLSKIINSYKDKNFTSYINDLRINYLVSHIQQDKKYQKYTIRAIAEEIGFSNPESFSRAFHKKTGLKPSYFIKKVREDAQKKL
ncbi:helix-turn-helix domain-containing protein [Kordia sp. YSTF-M3]|uniref:Helix-turn-helix domain-containing protein n=1 Tax=Kordia aestuariivivens TaxID=2759037 RepID=A0ABR7QAS0_9FLAO|nr:tetratricopeptide repeat protein [Kordia aestuariivivens]MBC8755645.1 helix-turn-helix domain-containing protein [Kordia aestuariivivens]